jgi:hypothetical protein
LRKIQKRKIKNQNEVLNMDEFTIYLLNKIAEHRKEALEEPTEKNIHESTAQELLLALVKYQNLIMVGGAV